MIVAAYGVVNHSPIEVSESLKRLSVSHTIGMGGAAGLRYLQTDVDGLSLEQPAWPVVTDYRSLPKLKISRSPQVLFVCSSRAQLMQTNISQAMWDRDPPLERVLMQVLLSLDLTKEWKLNEQRLSVRDYVSAASKPSILSDILTYSLKINPYALRKEIQLLVVSYLYGASGWTAVSKAMKNNHRLEPLFKTLQSPKVAMLKDAVQQYRKGMPLPQVVKAFDVLEFEVTYVCKSAERNLVKK